MDGRYEAFSQNQSIRHFAVHVNSNSNACRVLGFRGRVFSFGAVILDCITDSAKRFYQKWDFHELPGYPSRLYLSAQSLAAMVEERER